AMIVARHSQVKGAPNIDAELKGVIVPALQKVPYKLELLFLLVQRAIAAIDSQTGAEVKLAWSAVVTNKTGKQAGGESIIQIQSGNAGIRRRPGAENSGQHIHSVLEKAEPEVHQRTLGNSVVEANCKTVVANLRCTTKRYQ